MSLQELSDKELLIIADPILDNILDSARTNNYAEFSRDFHVEFANIINADEFNRQRSYSIERHGYVKKERTFLKCLRNEHSVIVLWVGEFDKLKGEILTGLNLRKFDNEIKVVGVWHHH